MDDESNRYGVSLHRSQCQDKEFQAEADKVHSLVKEGSIMSE